MNVVGRWLRFLHAVVFCQLAPRKVFGAIVEQDAGPGRRSMAMVCVWAAALCGFCCILACNYLMKL